MEHCKSCGMPLSYWDVWRVLFKGERRIRCASCGQQYSLARSSLFAGALGGLIALVFGIIRMIMWSQSASAALQFGVALAAALAVWLAGLFVAPVLLKTHKIPEIRVGR